MGRRRSNVQTSSAAEAPLVHTELPEGWALSTLAEVCHVNPPKPRRDQVEPTTEVTFVPMPAVDATSGTIAAPQIRQFSDVRIGFTAFRDNDVIMAKITPCMENGKAAVARGLRHGLGFGSTEFHVLRSRGAVLPDYVYHFIRQPSFRSAAALEMTGSVGQKRVPASFLESAEIPVPPLAEQKRIADRIETLLKSVDAARERLAKVPNILRLFRQSILAAACSGRLTEDWRDAHPDTEPSTNALARFDRDAAKHNGSDRRPAESTLDFELMPELPETWCYRRADSIVAPKTVITYGIVLPGPETPDGVPYVRQQDIQDGKVLIDQLRRTTGAIAAKHDRSRLHKGDVLLCIIRHLRVAVVPPGLDGANLTQGTVRMRPSAVMVGEFLALLLASPHTQSWMKQRHFGMSMPRINVEHAREIPVAVPPVTEQVEIVRRVRSLMNLAESIERRLAVAQVRTDKLTQAILARAYCGELVETEAELARAECRDYESGEALLARIQAKSDASHDARPARRPRVSRQPIVAATAAAPAYGSPPKRTHIPSAAQVSMEKP